MKILQPPGWPRPKGYSNGISASGRMIFTAGVVGWDEHGAFPDLSTASSRRRCAIRSRSWRGRRRARTFVRMTCYVTDRSEYLAQPRRDRGGVAAIMGANYPAMALVEVEGLIEAAAKVEIETTAVVPD